MTSSPSFFASLSKLQGLLQTGVVDEAILAQIEPLIADESIAREFFGHIEDPDWIPVLRDRGHFANPTAPEVVEGGSRCRKWPPSGYLVRMATVAPKEVADILSTLETDNWVVAADLVSATVPMPPAAAAMMVDCLGKHVARLGLSYLLDEVGAIVVRLANGGRPTDAIELSRRVFDPRLWKTAPIKGSGFDYSLEKALRDAVVPALLDVSARDLLPSLVDWLVGAVHPPLEPSGGDAHSWIWRPAIERHEQNRDREFASKMVSITRNAFEQAIKELRVPLAEAIAILDARAEQICRRLRIHLITDHGSAELIRATILDPRLFDDWGVRPEYARLVSTRFVGLSPAHQNEWLDLVDQAYARTVEENADTPESSERRLQFATSARYNRLVLVRDHLTGERKGFVDELFADRGEQLARFNSWSSGVVGVGHESAISVDDLRVLPFPEVLKRVGEWRPPPGASRFDGPSYEGLAGVLGQVIASDVVLASRHALLLRDLRPVLIKSYLGAMEAAAKSKQAFDVAQVLALCEWVVRRRPMPGDDRDQGDQQADTDADYWQWCRDGVSEVIQELCKARNEGGEPAPIYGIEHRHAVWATLQHLLNESSKSYDAEDGKPFDPRSQDWLGRAMNSSRGRAVLALCEFAGWVASSTTPRPDSKKPFPGGFESMPEVRDAFEAQLANAEEAGFTGRAVFGWRLHLLNWLDRPWLEKHIDAIFNLASVERDPTKAYGWAAWNSHLFANPPHKSIYQLLRPAYSYAVNEAAKIELTADSREEIWTRLGEHIVILYGRGDLGANIEEAWQADNAVLRRVVTRAHVRIRTGAIEFVGRSLYKAEYVVEAEVVERFQRLWEKYWAEVGEADARQAQRTSVFGYWFASKHFPTEWAIEQLLKVVSVAPLAWPDDIFMKRLGEVADVDPLRSAQIVHAMVEADEDSWRVDSWKDDAQKVLIEAMKAGGEAKECAEAAIDRLGRLGFVEFGALLQG